MFRPVVQEGEIGLEVASVDVSVSNDFCSIVGEVLGATDDLRQEITAALQTALAETVRLDALPEPFSLLPLSLSAARFEGAEDTLAVIIEGELVSVADE